MDDLDKTPGLHRVPEAELLRLMRAIARGEIASPPTRAGLLLARFTAHEQHLDAVIGMPQPAAMALLGAVLRERHYREHSRVTLAWSGPATDASRPRDPYELLADLLATAKQSVLWCGANLERDQRALRGLVPAVQARGLRARVVLDDARRADQVSALVRGGGDRFALYEPDGARLRDALPRFLVIDARRALILSGVAPRVEAADDALCVGLLVEDAAQCAELIAQCQGLIDAGWLIALAGRA
jgi:hypothetical protein